MQGHPYDMRVSYPAVIRYVNCPVRNIYAYSGNPFDRGNEPCNHVLAVPADHVVHYECYFPYIFTPSSVSLFSNRRLTHIINLYFLYISYTVL